MPHALAEVGRQTVKQLARSKWQSSVLSDKIAKKLNLKALSGSEVKNLHAGFHEAGALHIPYFDLGGKPTKFYRVRYLERLPGAAGLVEKPQRYDQLPVLQEAYYPPVLQTPWHEIAGDSRIHIYITEGELKAACACAHGIPMLALGGVYSFMSSDRGIDLLPSLKLFSWQGRDVTVVYDNDLISNPDVAKAQRRLAQRLLQEGARIFFANIPAGPHKGVDDYIRKYGSEKFQEVLDHAQPFAEGDALWAFNEEVCFIRKIDTVVERKTGLLMDPEKFKRHLYVDRTFMKATEVGSGNKIRTVLEETALAPRWMEWPPKATLWDITYDPGKPKIVNNSWNGWNGWGVTPKKGDVGPWLWLLDFLFANDPNARKYFERWCAYPIQHPGAKLYAACVLWSRVKRLGKSLVAMALSKIYGENATFVESRQLKSEFNTWAKNRQLVVGEEITAGEARIDADYLKFIITHESFPIRDLYVPRYDIPNHTNFLFLSNHPDAIFLEDGDERYMIHGITQTKPAPRAKYEWCDKWLHGEGPSYLMHYLQNLPLGRFNPREHPPQTESKYEMIVRGKTDTGLWVLRLQEDPTTALRALGERASQECDLYTAEQLYKAFDPLDKARGRSSIASLGKALASAGFRQVNGGKPVQTADKKVHRLCAVRNVVKWDLATRKEIREHYDAYFGAQSAGVVK